MLKDAVVMSPVYPSLLFANVPMVAMIFVRLQSGSRDCGLDGGAGDGRRSTRTRRAEAERRTAISPAFLTARGSRACEVGKKVGRRRCGNAIGAQPERLVDNPPIVRGRITAGTTLANGPEIANGRPHILGEG